MSSIKKAIMNFFEDISNAFSLRKNAIEKVIDENRDYLDALLKVSEESEEGINALKEYAETETPSLKDAVHSLARTYEIMEQGRRDRVKKLKNKFIIPMEELLTGLEQREKELKESTKAEKKMNKLKEKLEKQKGKPEEKKNPEKIEKLEQEVKEAEQNYEKEKKEAKIANETFNTEKLETIQSIIRTISEVESEYHQAVLNSLDKVKQKAEAIDTKEGTSQK
ncbi:MAG: BAR domain protein [Promethearchaeota archaeon]|nr:MAG: BAR domain protein [Candidatus Lokiarchaeota archaeon]